MGIFRSIVEPFVLAVRHIRQQLLCCRTIACQLIGDPYPWDVVTALEEFAQALLVSPFVPPALHQDIEQVPLLINRPPELVQFTVHFKKHLVELPCITCLSMAATELVGILLPKLLAPLANRRVRHDNPSSGQQLCASAIAE